MSANTLRLTLELNVTARLVPTSVDGSAFAAANFTLSHRPVSELVLTVAGSRPSAPPVLGSADPAFGATDQALLISWETLAAVVVREGNAGAGQQGALASTGLRLAFVGLDRAVPLRAEMLQSGPMPPGLHALLDITDLRLSAVPATCAADHWLNGDGRCERCPAGTVSAAGSTLSTNCSACPPGQFAAGSGGCAACPANTTTNPLAGAGNASCAPCPAGTALHLGTMECRDCQDWAGAGSTSAPGAVGIAGCSRCPAGSYLDNSTRVCFTCDAYRGFTAPLGAVGKDSCTLCPAGTFLSNAICSACPLGSASSEPGSLHCQQCQDGHQAVNGTHCVPCVAGSASRGGSACTTCPAGKFAHAVAANCTDCRAGTHAATAGSGECALCPPGTQPAADSTVCERCSNGTYAAFPGTATCLPCAAGSRSLTSSEGCKACPPGTSLDFDSNRCLPCAAGTVATASSETCLPCPPSYVPNTTQSGCVSCPAGMEAAPGAAACTACPPGWSRSEEQAMCLPCSPGKSAPDAGSAHCAACPPGSFSSMGATNCTMCPPTMISAAEDGACSPCSAGEQPEPAQNGCQPCKVGTFSAESGSLCATCPAGTQAASAGSTSCTPCPAGKVSPASGTSCSACEAGKLPSSNHTVCVSACSRGEHWDGAGCQLCPAGKFERDSSCMSCPDWMASNAGSTSCMRCPAGKMAEAGVCRSCPSGKVARWPGVTTCEPCPAGSASIATRTACEKCGPGTFAAAAASACGHCPSGHVPTADRSSCTACPAGARAMPGDERCTLCEAGKYSSAGAASCSLCSPGKYSETGSSSCLSCPFGTFQSNSGESMCNALPAGQYLAGTATSPSSCPSGTVSKGKMTGCFPCRPGTRAVSGSKCEPCEASQFSTTASDACMMPAGSSFDQRFCEADELFLPSAPGPSCVSACPAGTEVATPSSSTISSGYFASDTGCYYALVTAGTSSDRDFSSSWAVLSATERLATITSASVSAIASSLASTVNAWIGCHAIGRNGSFVWSSGEPLEYTAWASGDSLWEEGKECCLVTASGWKAEFCNSTHPAIVERCPTRTCAVCSAGKFSADGLTCSSCPAGKYSAAGASECITCPAGKSSSDGSATCSDCSAGSFSLPGAGSCSHCSAIGAGFFAPSLGMSTCFACGPGEEASGDMTACAACSAGKANNVTGGGCTTCPAGTYAATGHSECVPCSAGKYSAQGAESCAACAGGSAALSYGTPDACNTCSAGTAAYFPRTSCRACRNGEHVYWGSSSCSPCVSGSVAWPESRLCEACGPGKYSSGNGTTCLPCPAGFVSKEARNSECELCGSNEYASSPSSCSHLGSGAKAVGGLRHTCPTQHASCMDVVQCPTLALHAFVPSAKVTHTWKSTTFSLPFDNRPAVFSWLAAGGAKSNNADMRIMSVTKSSFSYAAKETLTNDGTYPADDAFFLAVEHGEHRVGGARVIAGEIETSKTVSGWYSIETNAAASSWEWIPFSTPFAAAPAVFAQVITANSEQGSANSVSYPWIHAAVSNVTTRGFSLSLERSKVGCNATVCDNGQPVQPETVSYIVWEQGAGKLTKLPGSAERNWFCTVKDLTNVNIAKGSSGQAEVQYPSSFTGPDRSLLVQLNQRADNAGSWLRFKDVDDDEIKFGLENDLAARPSPLNIKVGILGIGLVNSAFQLDSAFSSTCACAAGAVPSTTSMSCLTCPAGTFADNHACLPCAPGTSAASGSTSCSACPSGEVAPEYGSLCRICPAGTFEVGRKQCQPCFGSEFSSSAGATSCSQCPAGSVSNSNRTGCLTCPTGWVARQGAERCWECPAGTAPNSDRSDCSPCATGSHQPLAGQPSCDTCPAGTASGIGAKSCVRCSPGSNGCQLAHRFTPSCGGGSIPAPGGDGCGRCPNGTWAAANATTCTACEAGKIAAANGTACIACPAGMVPDFTASHCINCPPGRIPTDDGLRCSLCDEGKYLVAGACQPCPAGKIGHSGDCFDCPAGTVPSADRTTCETCNSSTVSIPGSSVCSPCPDRHVPDPASRARCAPCLFPLWWNSSSAACTVCSRGEALVGESCIPCPTGTVPNANRTACVACKSGFVSSEGADGCTPCAAGASSNPSASACIACPVGTTSGSGASYCTPCEPGTFSNATATTHCELCPSGSVATAAGQAGCERCTAGKYANWNQSACLACPSGSTTEDGAQGAEQCRACPVGKVLQPSGQCQSCAAGAIAAVGAPNCTTCPPGREPSFDAGRCVACLPGKYSATGSSCQACSLGYHAPSRNASACTPCPAGTKGQAGGVCAPCPLGSFSAAPASTSCAACPTGWASSASATSCSPCPAGTRLDPSTQTCRPCLAGKWSAGNATSCSPCGLGSYAPAEGSSACISCSPGSVPTSSSTGCSMCEAGKFAMPGLATCSACPVGKISRAGSANCTVCSGGHVPRSTKDGCTPCGPGLHAPWGSSWTSCQPCPVGTAPSANRTDCVPCVAGKVAATAGSSQCSSCPAGEAPNAEATACIACPTGWVASVGAAHCTPCPAGTFADASRTTCTACGPGTSSAPGAASCTPCGPGRAADGSGTAWACPKCPPGTSKSSATSCEQCSAGRFAREGADTCTLCSTVTARPSGTYGSGGRSEADCVLCAKRDPEGGVPVGNGCRKCSPGSYLSDDNECLPCPHGTYQQASENTGARSSCLSCPAHAPGTVAEGTDAESKCKPCGWQGTQLVRGGSCTVNCPPGRFLNASSAACAPCPKGTYASYSSVEDVPLQSCTSCPSGKGTLFEGSSNSTSCLTCFTRSCGAEADGDSCASVCSYGHYLASGVCEQCPRGKFQALVANTGGLSSCTQCATGLGTTMPAATSSGFCRSCDGMAVASSLCLAPSCDVNASLSILPAVSSPRTFQGLLAHIDAAPVLGLVRRGELSGAGDVDVVLDFCRSTAACTPGTAIVRQTLTLMELGASVAAAFPTGLLQPQACAAQVPVNVRLDNDEASAVVARLFSGSVLLGTSAAMPVQRSPDVEAMRAVPQAQVVAVAKQDGMVREVSIAGCCSAAEVSASSRFAFFGAEICLTSRCDVTKALVWCCSTDRARCLDASLPTTTALQQRRDFTFMGPAESAVPRKSILGTDSGIFVTTGSDYGVFANRDVWVRGFCLRMDTLALVPLAGKVSAATWASPRNDTRLVSATFDRRYAKIVATFDSSIAFLFPVKPTVDCSSVFENAESLLGIGAVCTQHGDRAVEVTIGSVSTLSVGGTLSVARTLAAGSSVSVADPADGIEMVVRMSAQAPTRVGECEDVVIDCSSSSGAFGKPFSFTFAVGFGATDVGVDTTAVEAAAAAARRTGILRIPQTALYGTGTLVVVATGTNVVGNSDSVRVAVQRVLGTVASVKLEAPTSTILLRSQSVTIASRFSLPHCAAVAGSILQDSLPTELAITWQIPPTWTHAARAITRVNEEQVLDKRTFLIPSFVVGLGSPAEASTLQRLRAVVHPAGAAVGTSAFENWADIELFATPQCPVVEFVGGTAMDVGAAEASRVDGSASWDPDRVVAAADMDASWSCTMVPIALASSAAPTACTGANSSSMAALGTSLQLKFGPDTLAVGVEYRFKLTLRKSVPLAGECTRSGTYALRIFPGRLPAVSVASKLNRVNPGQDIRLEGAAQLDDQELQLAWSWGGAGGTPAVALDSVARTLLTGPALVVDTAGLPSSREYEFRLTATAASGAPGSSSTLVAINGPPSFGYVDVSPALGVAVDTVFAMTATLWADEPSDLPLQYNFGVFDTFVEADLSGQGAYVEGQLSTLPVSRVQVTQLQPEFSLVNSISAVLPKAAAVNGSVLLVVYVRDSPGATTTGYLSSSGMPCTAVVAPVVSLGSSMTTEDEAKLQAFAADEASRLASAKPEEFASASTRVVAALKTFEDGCDSVTCAFGECIDGSCMCLPGFQGERCEGKEPLHGRFGEWGPWTACSRWCGGGWRERFRLCNSPPSLFGGFGCDAQGFGSEREQCNTDPCAAGELPLFDALAARKAALVASREDPAELAQLEGLETEDEPAMRTKLQEEFGYEWSNWTACSNSCVPHTGGAFVGSQSRQRPCVVADERCPSTGFMVQTRLCNTAPCPWPEKGCPGSSRNASNFLIEQQCSGHGSCTYPGRSAACTLGDVYCSPVCACDEGWSGLSCTKPASRRGAVQELRTSALTVAARALTGLKDASSSVLFQQTSVLRSVTGERTELGDAALEAADTATSSLLDAANRTDGSAIDTDSASQLTGAISNVLFARVHVAGGSNSASSASNSSMDSAIEGGARAMQSTVGMVSRLGVLVGAESSPEEEPRQIGGGALSVAASRVGQGSGGASTAVSGASFDVPSSALGGGGAGGGSFLVAATFEENPIAYLPESSAMMTTPVSINVVGSNGTSLPVSGLTAAPVTFSITLTGVLEGRQRPECTYFDPVRGRLTTEGVFSLGTSRDAQGRLMLRCASTHMSEFAASANDAMPPLAVPNPVTDADLLGNFNASNMAPAILIGAVLLSFLVVMAAVSRLDAKRQGELVKLMRHNFIMHGAFLEPEPLPDDMDDGEEPPRRSGNFACRAWIAVRSWFTERIAAVRDSFTDEHTVLSIILAPVEQSALLTRTQRLGILLSEVITGFCVSAMMFGAEPERLDQTLVTSVLTMVIMYPCTVIFPNAFYKANWFESRTVQPQKPSVVASAAKGGRPKPTAGAVTNDRRTGDGGSDSDEEAESKDRKNAPLSVARAPAGRGPLKPVIELARLDPGEANLALPAWPSSAPSSPAAGPVTNPGQGDWGVHGHGGNPSREGSEAGAEGDNSDAESVASAASGRSPRADATKRLLGSPKMELGGPLVDRDHLSRKLHAHRRRMLRPTITGLVLEGGGSKGQDVPEEAVAGMAAPPRPSSKARRPAGGGSTDGEASTKANLKAKMERMRRVTSRQVKALKQGAHAAGAEGLEACWTCEKCGFDGNYESVVMCPLCGQLRRDPEEEWSGAAEEGEEGKRGTEPAMETGFKAIFDRDLLSTEADLALKQAANASNYFTMQLWFRFAAFLAGAACVMVALLAAAKATEDVWNVVFAIPLGITSIVHAVLAYRLIKVAREPRLRAATGTIITAAVAAGLLVATYILFSHDVGAIPAVGERMVSYLSTQWQGFYDYKDSTPSAMEELMSVQTAGACCGFEDMEDRWVGDACNATHVLLVEARNLTMPGCADFIVSRGVAALTPIYEWCLPLLALHVIVAAMAWHRRRRVLAVVPLKRSVVRERYALFDDAAERAAIMLQRRWRRALFRKRVIRKVEFERWYALKKQRRCLVAMISAILGIYIAFALYMALLYCVFFDEPVARAWMITCVVSLVADLVLQQPGSIFMKSALMSVLLPTFQGLFFNAAQFVPGG